MIPSEPTRIRTIAWVMRSELTTGPIVVKLRCSVIGPSSFSSATRISPRVPVVGRFVLPPGFTDGDGLAEPDAEGAGDPEGDGDGLGDGLADGLDDGEADAAGEADGFVDPEGAPEAPALALGASVATGEADGTGASPIGSVLIWMYPSLVLIAVAANPCATKTASTWSGVTVGSANLISQTVPPV